ncbi:MAG TPA: transposase family protein [Ramlibacter sp.]|nr:transposase family protein [Ramlibacter sp.]
MSLFKSRGDSVHDEELRSARPGIFDSPVELVLPQVLLACPTCGPKLEHLDWLEPYARVTVRLAARVARLCKVMTLRHVASFYGLAWTTVKLIDHRQLERELQTGRAPGDEVEVILDPIRRTGIRLILKLPQAQG